MASPIDFITSKFVSIKSSRLIPGLLGIPAVIIMASLSLMFEISSVPLIKRSKPSTARLCERSRHFPSAKPSTLSIKTMLPRFFLEIL